MCCLLCFLDDFAGMGERAALRAQRKAEREQKMREKEEEKLVGRMIYEL